MERPAASSAALLILKPDDNFSIDLPAAVLFVVIWRCVLRAEML
jgi:hypothetical protein